MICSQGKGQVYCLPRGGGYLNFVSEKGLGQPNLPGKGNIVAFNGSALLGNGVGFNIQIVCGPAIGACLAFPCQTDFFSLGQPFGNFYLNGLGCPSLADGNGFFTAIDEFINGQRKLIFKILAPNRGLTAASAASRALGKGVSPHAGESAPGTSPTPAKAELF